MVHGLGVQVVMTEQAQQELLTAVVERVQGRLLTSQEVKGDECWSLADLLFTLWSPAMGDSAHVHRKPFPVCKSFLKKPS